MIKVWCETCEGSSNVTLNEWDKEFGFVLCPDCNGKGYTEHEGSLEDFELAQAVKLFFSKKNWTSCFSQSLGMATHRLYSINDILHWFRKEKGHK